MNELQIKDSGCIHSRFPNDEAANENRQPSFSHMERSRTKSHLASTSQLDPQ
jgi:hypothetical protein